jgi:hypothetical protein
VLSHVNKLLFSPAHTRTEGRAPALGFVFTTKPLYYRGCHQNWHLRPDLKFMRLPACVAPFPYILKTQNFRRKSDQWRKASMWPFNAAWRAARGRCAPLPNACRYEYTPGRAAGGLCRGLVPQAQAA